MLIFTVQLYSDGSIQGIFTELKEAIEMIRRDLLRKPKKLYASVEGDGVWDIYTFCEETGVFEEVIAFIMAWVVK